MREATRTRRLWITAVLTILAGLVLPLLSTSQASAAAACSISRYGYTGYYVCGTSVSDTTWRDGHKETFVIGINNQIWHITSYTGGWKSLGGTAKSWVGTSYTTWGNGTNKAEPVIVTLWKDNSVHCRTYTGGKWNGWHKCAMRTDVIRKAKNWLTAKNGRPVPYSQTARFQGWRPDCSGYVSMAWNTQSNPASNGGFSTVSLPNISHRITWNDLRAGDIIGNLGPGTGGDAGHVMIFDKWANSAKTQYWVYEQSGGANKTVHRTHPKTYNHYLPWRYDTIVDA
jgi:hypothetical protein